MKILGICGSPRKGGNTEFSLHTCLNALKEKGFETEAILLAEKDVKYCNHCGDCLDKKSCPIKDDAMGIFEKMIGADGIVVASPVYYAGVTAQLKALFDRSIMIRGKLKGKVGGAIAVGQSRNGGQEFTCEQIVLWMMAHEMRVVPLRFGGTVVSSLKELDAAKKDEMGLKTCVRLAEKMAEYLTGK